jgi:hypothetical protein
MPHGLRPRRGASTTGLGPLDHRADRVEDLAVRRLGLGDAGQLDFRGVTPSRSWEAGDRETMICDGLRRWFEDEDHIDAVERLETDAFADRDRVTNPTGHFLVEQQVYIAERDGRIGWMRSTCSGFRPAPSGD